jgi:hypothetical protein
VTTVGAGESAALALGTVASPGQLSLTCSSSLDTVTAFSIELIAIQVDTVGP